MSDVERRLQEVDPATAFPPTPDLAAAVLARIADVERSTATRAPWMHALRARPALALALAAILAAGALLGASPAARSAILDLLGLQAARIERGEPSSPRDVPPDLGREVSLAEAHRLAGFELAIPGLARLGPPARIGFDPSGAPGGTVALAWERRRDDASDRGRAQIVLTQSRATATPLLLKTAPAGTRVERVQVGGRHGYWLAGAPHEVELLDPEGSARPGTARLAGRTLLWQQDRLLLRLEGAGSKARALEIARSIDSGRADQRQVGHGR